MSFNKLSAVMLAGSISMAAGAVLAAAPAMAMTPVSELKDVSPDHWAYNAIRTLTEKYQVMEGFPDKTFRGSKTLTRYELAAALAKLMARVEQRIAQATGQPVDVEPGVNPEDLRTIGRLQREFREELDALKSRVDTIDSRVTALEKRVKVTGISRIDYRDFIGGGTLANQPWADFRFRNGLQFNANLVEDLELEGRLNIDVYNPQSLSNPFLRGTGNNPITDIYTPKFVLTSGSTFALGLTQPRNHMALGSRLADPFRQNIWNNGTGGYGFVGIPGLQTNGSLATNGVATLQTPNNAVGPRVWVPGTNVMVDTFDPNGSRIYNPTGDLFTSVQTNFLGPVKFGFGVKRDGLTGPFVNGGTTNLPLSVPQFGVWQDGAQFLGTIGVDLGLARLSMVAMSPTDSTFNGGFAAFDKTVGVALDVGTDALGATAELVAPASFAFNRGFNPTKGSLRVGSMNILDTGFGLSVGAVTGSVLGFPAPGAEFGTPVSIFGGNADYTSLGLVLKTPAAFVLPSFTLAVQNTGPGLSAAGFNGNTAASGFTASADFNLFGLPTLTAEYSLGKFAAGQPNALWGSGAVTDQQVEVMTMLKF